MRRTTGYLYSCEQGSCTPSFETIHPLLDGNGRVGRLLTTLLLCEAGLLRNPLLYLSLYLKHHRTRYYDLLTHVRETGDWEEWLAFFGTYIDYLTTYAASLRSVSRVAGVAECDRPSPCSRASPRRRMLRAAFRSA